MMRLQGDLTGTPCDPLDSNLYINPLESPSPRGGGVKKSASGDTGLRSLGASPLEEAYRGFGAPERGSRGSLNDTPLPKHRKTRFQQVHTLLLIIHYVFVCRWTLVNLFFKYVLGLLQATYFYSSSHVFNVNLNYKELL